MVTIFDTFETQNKWLYILSKAETLTLNCKDKNEPIDVSLVKTGTVTIHENCKGYTSTVVLLPERNFTSEFLHEFISSFNLELDCCTDDSKRKFTLTNIIFDSSFKISTLHQDELNLAS